MNTISRQWIEPEPHSVSEATLAACGGDPFLASILIGRGLVDPNRIRAYLSPAEYAPTPPEQLPDLVRASELIQQAIAAAQPLLVWGDFDVDGQTATALLVDGLRHLDAQVSFYIPNRATESHGINLTSLEQQISRHTPRILLTCDTGITEYESIERARSLGLAVIVTDHHDLGDHLPSADAIVNPKRLRPDHPLHSLPGVGVTYKLMQRLYASQGRDPSYLLDLVALGIVSDVAFQTADTRYLLQIGLERLRQTGRIGLQALVEVAKLPITTLSAEQIGYQIGPRLNAAGRLADAALAVELLLTRDRARSYVIAQQLEGYNNQRRSETRQIEAVANEMLRDDPSLLNYTALVLYHPNWHPGLIGIVANQLAERYQRPAVLLTGDAEGVARGSARSISGYDIHRAIAVQAGLLRKFGGHPGAAGLSLDVQNIGPFRRLLSQTLAESRTTPIIPTLTIDAIVSLDQLTLDLAKRLQKLAPFGEGNPALTLATLDVHLGHAAIIGRDGQHRKLTVEDSEGHQQTLLWWESASQKLPVGRFDVAYHLNVNERQELEAVLMDYRERASETELVQPHTVQIEDWRQEPQPLAKLNAILTPDCLIWAEAYPRQQDPTWKRRAELIPAPTLIIYTAPSDAQTLDEALQTVQPRTIHVFGVESPLNTLEAVLKQLHLAVRNVIDHLDGEVSLDVLCGATAQSPQVIRAMLELFAAEGKQTVHWLDDQTLRLSAPGNALDEDRIASCAQRLQKAFDEVSAYRRFFRKMSLSRLVSA